LFLDEATSALDEAMEARLYQLLSSELNDTTLISITHRPQLARFHQQRLRLVVHENPNADRQDPAAATVQLRLEMIR
jgi:vitamin B12/bleomycin/antimicrobial peptide transport system ATP-binding/permease protein